MNKEETIAALNALKEGPDDAEGLHVEADDILLSYLMANGAPEVAAAYREARERIGFWYA